MLLALLLLSLGVLLIILAVRGSYQNFFGTKTG